MKEAFDKLIREAESICILGHINPDGDCLGSTLGTRQYIMNRYPGKIPDVYLMRANEKFSFLPGFDEIIHSASEKKYGLAIVCDCASFDRLGDFAVLAENAGSVYVADHHVSNNAEYEYCTILPNASSACEVLFDLMDREYINKEAAVCFYTGIVHDTGVFRYQSTSPHTMEIAGFLMSTGIDYGWIIDDSFFTKTYAQQQVTGRVLLESRRLLNGRVLAGALNMKQMRFHDVTSRDIEGIVSMMRETRGIAASVFIYEIAANTWKVSLRSNTKSLDLAKAASAFGGGGHKMAAGCVLQGSCQDVLDKIMKELSGQLDSGGRSDNFEGTG